MTRKRYLGNLAAIGGITAGIALLTGFSAARADELADLRANQQLLQQRIDQLAQAQAQGAPPPHLAVPGMTGAAAYGTKPVPGAELVGGSFPRSFLIPGTDTSIRVGGFVDETIDYWFQNGPANGTQNTTVSENGNLLSMPLNITGQTIPGLPTKGNAVPVNVQASRGNGVFQQSPRESRLNVETRTPTAYGEARTFMEFDWAGSGSLVNNATHVSDSLLPRLRYAYGTLGGFLAGQANSNFADPDANPETLDFGGPVGESGVVRIPQVRYTYAGPWGSAWSTSLETPETDVLTPAGQIQTDSNSTPSNSISSANTNGCVANGIVNGQTPLNLPGYLNTSSCTLPSNITKSSAPDITFASYWSQPWGHVDFRGVIRPTLQVNDGRYVNDHFVGYGGGISGSFQPGWFGWGKDNFGWQFTTGTGIGRYLNDSGDAALVTNYNSGNAPKTAADAANIIVKPVFAFGGTVGYQHWWLPNLRSNVSYGYERHSYSSQLLGPLESAVANKQLQTAHVNLIWSPVAFIDTGIEYFWGQRQVVANMRGQQQGLIGKFRVKF
jgi:Porin subfamily/DcaP outer membrane protein